MGKFKLVFDYRRFGIDNVPLCCFFFLRISRDVHVPNVGTVEKLCDIHALKHRPAIG